MTAPYFLHFCDYPPFEKDLALLIEQFRTAFTPRVTYTKFDWNWPPGSEEDFFPIHVPVNMVFPIVAPSGRRGPRCVQFSMYIISESFYENNMTYSGLAVLEKKIFKWPQGSKFTI
jgi:hypothetical protein